MLTDKHILVGISGGVGAYKAAILVRALQERGASVKVVMTKSAQAFIGKMSLYALSHEPVLDDLFDETQGLSPHIGLTLWADAMVIAPATANCLAKLACGLADDALSTCALACNKPLFVAPAMNVHMYENQATQANLASLVDRGIIVLEPEEGYLACGYEGKGRMQEPDQIVSEIEAYFARTQDLAGKHILITAGPTQEPIDPVRYISNHSSGKMGYALAQEALNRGAQVTLISGPVSLVPPDKLKLIRITTAQELFEAVKAQFACCDVAIACAAVSDYRPSVCAQDKLKKGKDEDLLGSIKLTQNPDSLAWMAQAKRPEQFVVGFAAETSELINHAKRKLDTKACDALVANKVGKDTVFCQAEANAFWLTRESCIDLGTKPKSQLAGDIFDRIVSALPN